MTYHIIDESKRCLQCKSPRCKTGCPISTDIPGMIQLLLEGRITDAGALLFENNPLSLICSLVCNHENQCEGHCVLAKKDSSIGSVHISSIEHYISDHYMDLLRPVCNPNPMKKIAIIGSGPAGLTIAIMLAKWGYSITIFEAHDKIGGVLRYGIPEFRLPKSHLERYKKILDQMGIRYRPNIVIGQGGLVLDDLFRDGYKAVFIGTGVWKPKTLGIKGESLGHVHFAINYLHNPDVYQLGKRVIVIGAGNSAMDAVRTALRSGVPDITCFYVMGEEQMAASRTEYEYARIEGLQMEFFKKPVEITDEGVIFSDTKPTESAEPGRHSYEEIPGSSRLFPADSVIISISQGPQSYIVSTTTGLELRKTGLVLTDDDGLTTKNGVFASGDVVSGAKTVVEAVLHSKAVAQSIAQYVDSVSSNII